MATHRFSASRAVPIDPQGGFDQVLALPLPDIFAQRFGALPAIREVRDQRGEWGSVGQPRTIVLTDGNTMLETLVAVDRPHRFAYVIDQVTGPMKLLTSTVDGEWSFAPAGTGLRVTWTWTLHPPTRAAALVMPAFGWMWRGYADRALARIETLLAP